MLWALMLSSEGQRRLCHLPEATEAVTRPVMELCHRGGHTGPTSARTYSPSHLPLTLPAAQDPSLSVSRPRLGAVPGLCPARVSLPLGVSLLLQEALPVYLPLQSCSVYVCVTSKPVLCLKQRGRGLPLCQWTRPGRNLWVAVGEERRAQHRSLKN